MNEQSWLQGLDGQAKLNRSFTDPERGRGAWIVRRLAFTLRVRGLNSSQIRFYVTSFVIGLVIDYDLQNHHEAHCELRTPARRKDFFALLELQLE